MQAVSEAVVLTDMIYCELLADAAVARVLWSVAPPVSTGARNKRKSCVGALSLGTPARQHKFSPALRLYVAPCQVAGLPGVFPPRPSGFGCESALPSALSA